MIRFAKAHAYGNDFLYVRADAVADVRLDAFARELCDRHTGIGADGLIVYEPTPDGASMRLFNADGSRAEVSGNGVRALGAILLNGIEPNAPVSREITIHTEAGPKRLTLVGLRRGSSDVSGRDGLPRATSVRFQCRWTGKSLSPIVMDMGNPQAVLLGPLPDAGRLPAPSARHSNVIPRFRQAPTRVRRGRGARQRCASSSGSAASARRHRPAPDRARRSWRRRRLAAPAESPRSWRRAEPSGSSGSDDSVYLTGWAEVLCSGEWHRQVPRTP